VQVRIWCNELARIYQAESGGSSESDVVASTAGIERLAELAEARDGRRTHTLDELLSPPKRRRK